MAKKKKTKRPSEENLSFEEALQQLETVVRQLESSELGLNDAMEQYENGVRFLRVCHKTLAEAENKIEMLTRVDGEGNAESRPFELGEDEESLETKQDRRAKRRSADPPELF